MSAGQLPPAPVKFKLTVNEVKSPDKKMDVDSVCPGASETFSAEEFVHWAATCCMPASKRATVMANKM